MIEAAPELLKNLPTLVQVILLLPVFGMMFFIKPGVDAFNSWRTTRAETRKTNAETDLKLIDKYKELLERFEKTNELQSKEIRKLQTENMRLHETTDKLVNDAEKLHSFVRSCITKLRELDVPTDEMPGLPTLDETIRKDYG